jgi:hypothetical protein
MYGTRFIIYKEYSIRSSYIERSIPKELYIRAPPAVAVFLSPAGAKASIWIMDIDLYRICIVSIVCILLYSVYTYMCAE